MDYRVELKNILEVLELEIFFNNGELGKAVYLFPPKKVIDDTTKILIFNKKREKIAVLICSYTKYSILPERNLKKSQKIKQFLGLEVSNVIIDPLLYGNKNGISFVVWPYYYPLSRNTLLKNIQFYKIKKPILNWLRELIRLTLKKPTKREISNRFLIPLQNLHSNYNLSSSIKDEICNSIGRLKNGGWNPFFSLAHNDLWSGNILLKRKNGKEIFIIDWGGSSMKSYPINDLSSVFRRLNYSRKDFVKELKIHSEILNCELEDTKSYLLSSLASLGMNLDQFPEERFLQVVESSCNYLFSALDSVPH